MRQPVSFFVILFLALVSAQASAQSPAEALQAQITAFNAHDIDQLTNNVSDDFKWFSVYRDSMTTDVDGKAAFRASMEEYFQYIPDVKSEVTAKAISGNKISFEERVSWQGKKGEMTQACIGVYEVKGGKITRAWYYVE